MIYFKSLAAALATSDLLHRIQAFPSADYSASLPSTNYTGPTFDQFKIAVQAYKKTSAAGPGIVPDPSQSLYDAFQKYVIPSMPLKEQAMFMANAVWETGALQHMEEMDCKTGACPYGQYYGRGIIQLTHDYNYQEASSDVYQDNRLVTNPNLVSEPEGAFRTALWFWTKRVRPALKLADIEEYNLGPSIKIINALECPAVINFGVAFVLKIDQLDLKSAIAKATKIISLALAVSQQDLFPNGT
ncbi:putative glycoside hydrolase family 19 chitinase domain protein [Paramicrosporidium saccamoebae]|uniref:Putative glycoside hydrolase family 19 chitinase domain protein n=1 Tax=Paramicrosporidium saccamoebae TaxID=1246581 RepID=A0A2H9TFK9_9FUNG|nr:putative glycoside hydrolase family 19 chitinase domain protein [Paramicrosporidium saccamoebae]